MMMESFLLGVRYGLMFGVLGWFVGWIVGKSVKLIRYVAR